MSRPSVTDTARALVAGDRGILAMDESNPTCNERFAALGIPQTEEARRAYRSLLATTPGLGAGVRRMRPSDGKGTAMKTDDWIWGGA